MLSIVIIVLTLLGKAIGKACALVLDAKNRVLFSRLIENLNRTDAGTVILGYMEAIILPIDIVIKTISLLGHLLHRVFCRVITPVIWLELELYRVFPAADGCLDLGHTFLHGERLGIQILDLNGKGIFCFVVPAAEKPIVHT